MKYQQWSIPELPAGAVDRLTGAGYPYLVSSVLASRGIFSHDGLSFTVSLHQNSAGHATRYCLDR